jgi:hypothetical protein
MIQDELRISNTSIDEATPAATTTVPQPGTLALLSVGGVWLGWRRWARGVRA